MGGWAFFFFVAAVMLGVSLLIGDMMRRRHELDWMIRIRNSPMYYDLYPMVRFARKHDLDRVQVERTRIIFYGVNPPGVLASFVLDEWGHKALPAHLLRALTLVLAEDIAALQDREWYRLRRYTVERPNGKKDAAYRYTITNKYKSQLMAARRQTQLY